MKIKFASLLLAGALGAGLLEAQGNQQGNQQPGIEQLRKEIDSLRATDVPWRKVPWKSCLLEGLAESKKTGKPVMLWIFIDRPVDDARC